MAKGAHVHGQGGYSLAEAIEGTAPGGVSSDTPDPPPARCRWPECRTFLSVRNRPKGKRVKAEKSAGAPPPDLEKLNESGVLPLLVAAETAGMDTGLVEAVAVPEDPKRIRPSDPPDDHQLCFVHQRMTHDWHQGYTDVRPAHYPPELPEEPAKRQKKT